MALDLAALKTELTTDPLTLGYNGSDIVDAALINDESLARSIARVATVEDVRQYLLTQDDGTGANKRSSLAMIKEYAELGTVRGASAGETAAGARRSGAVTIWYMLQREESSAVFPVSNANMEANFTAIGPDGGNGPTVLTGAQLNAINALAAGTGSRAQELFGRSLTTSELAYARLT